MRPSTRARLAIVSTMALGVGVGVGATSGCGGGGGGGSSRGGSAQAGSTAGSSTTNQPQWQTAMAALAAQPTPDPLRLQGPALQAFNALLARTWPHLAPILGDGIDGFLQGQVGQTLTGGIRILQVHSVRVDASAGPGVFATQPASAYPTVEIALPAPPATWSIAFTAEVGGNVTIDLLGIRTSIPVHVDLAVNVRDISIVQGVDVDLTQPDDMRMLGARAPQIRFRLEVASSAPLVGTVASALTSALDPIIRVALTLGAGFLQNEIGLVLQQSLPQGPSWGLGGPGLQQPAARVALEPLAIATAETIQRDHMPFDHVFPAEYDTAAGTGGTVVGWSDHGDSAIWTGHYLASEAYRYDLTGSAQALQHAERTVRGLGLLLDVASPGGGLLSRAAIPTWSPHSQVFTGSRTHAYGVVNGTQYIFLEHISRDQYTGFMLGNGQAWYRVPPLRAQAGALIERVVGYLEAGDWIARRADHVHISTQFVQSPGTLLAFSRLGAVVNPGRFDAAYQRVKPLASFLWLPDWFSSREVHESYYKFNLGHANLLTSFELETEPDQYRGLLQKMRMLRTTIGHHDNAWFDAIYAVAVPTEIGTVGPKVETELQCWAARPRRGFTIQNSADPTIQTALYTVTTPNASGGMGFPQFQTAPRSKLVALYPLPIEKQPYTDFLWQRDPFRLDGGVSPHYQAPGIDLCAPYWLARNHGLFQ